MQMFTYMHILCMTSAYVQVPASLSACPSLFLLLMLESLANPTQGPWPHFWWRFARNPGNTDSARPNHSHSSRVWSSHPHPPRAKQLYYRGWSELWASLATSNLAIPGWC